VYSLPRNVFTEPLPSDVKGTHILMGSIYEVRRRDGLRYHDTHTKFHNDWFRHSEIYRGIYIQTQTQTQSHEGDLISLFQNKESRLKITYVEHLLLILNFSQIIAKRIKHCEALDGYV
jgi:hypothetical protein